MSDLRTRIVAALERADKEPQSFDEGPVGYEYLADAVIRELGLRQERRGPVTAYRDGQYYPDSSIVRVMSDWVSQHD